MGHLNRTGTVAGFCDPFIIPPTPGFVKNNDKISIKTEGYILIHS